MPVDRKKKILFIHIPKTGGGSIEKAMGLWGFNNAGSNFINQVTLYGYISVNYKNRNVFRSETKVNNWLSHWYCFRNLLLGKTSLNTPLQHASFLEIENILNLNKYFKFSIVRNPYTRVISTYNWLMSNNDIDMSFQDFVFNYIPSQINTNYYLTPQNLMLINQNGEINIDFIGRFEKLFSDFNKLKSKFDFEGEIPSIHQRKYSKEIKYFDEKTKAVICKFYKKDFELFDYSLELPF
jgi:hypothetical protein